MSFANCGLPYYIGGEIERRSDLLVATPRLFRERFNVDVRVRHEVTAIDRAARTVTVLNRESGRSFSQAYDRLILAPGASPIVPHVEGVGSANVFTLRNLEDMDRIRECVRSKALSAAAPSTISQGMSCAPATGRPRSNGRRRHVDRAVVIGAGFIGLEMVEQLRGLGVETALVELMDQVLPPLDPEMAHLVQEELTRKQVALHLGDGLSAIRHVDGVAVGVRLASGAELDADVVILGVGVRPNTQLAKAAGLELGAMGGIKVNRFMQTSDPCIYAVGDAVEYLHAVTGTPMRAALAGPANRAGRIAGQHAATDRAAPMAPVLGTAIVRVFERTAAITGLSVKLARKLGIEARAVVISAKDHAGYYPGGRPLVLKLVYEEQTGRIVGAQSVGSGGVDKRIDVIATAMGFGATVGELAGVDLAYAPPYGSAKDPIHLAAFAAGNDLDGLTRFAQVDEDLDGRQIVDVRSDAEFARFRLRGAKHLPLDDLRAGLETLDPKRPTVTICHSGQRAHVAARILSQHGFHNVADLTGGMLMRQHARPEEVIAGEH